MLFAGIVVGQNKGSAHFLYFGKMIIKFLACGAVGKAAVVGLKERDGAVVAMHVHNVDKPTLHGIITDTVLAGYFNRGALSTDC